MDTPAPAPHSDEVAVAENQTTRRRMTITITPRTLWLAAFVAVAILAALLLLTKAQGVTVLFLLAIILGEAIRPLVVRLRRFRVPGPLAGALIYVATIIIGGVLLWLLLNPLLSEIIALATSIPHYLVQLQDDIRRLEQSMKAQGVVTSALNGFLASLTTWLQGSIPALLAVPINLLTSLFALFVNTVIVVFMSLFWLSSSAKLKPFVVGLFPLQQQERASLVISEVGRGFGGYVRGILISMVIIGVISGIGLLILGVPYALLLGFVAGLTEVLPYIGPWISGSIAVVVALIAVDPAKAIQVVILFILIQELEGNIVAPLVMSRSVRVDPLVVVVSVLIGLSLLGVVGAFLAVPIAAGIQVLVIWVLAPALRRASGQGDQAPSVPTAAAQAPARPAARAFLPQRRKDSGTTKPSPP